MEVKPSILIVEDSLIVALHLQSTLESENYDVIGKCSSGEEAIELIKKQKPTLVLMDIMLNGKMDGIDAAGIIKSLYDLPVIYITALTDKDTIKRAKVTEPYGYLTKPFEDREIFTVIEMALYKHGIEQKLKQSEEKYFSTIKSISDAVIVIDNNFLVTYINPSASALLQQTLHEAHGKRIENVLRVVSEEATNDLINPLQCPTDGHNGNAMPNHLLLKTIDGRFVPIGESSMSLLLDAQERFTGLIIIFRDLTEKKEHQRLTRELQKQKLAALIEGQETERSRIAKDLHDGLGQILNAIKMNVSLLVDNKQKANDLDKLLDEAIQESVRISENLLPAKLKDFDLATCLRSLCKNMNETGRVPIKFETGGISVNLDQKRKVNLYRIAQEGITNAIKHARATEISVRLEGKPAAIQLSIRDNGKGINPSLDDRSHNGLINIRERAEILEGKLSIDSNPQKGTLIVIDAPIQLN